MPNVYRFTDDERAWAAEARAEYERRLQAIIQIHKVQGSVGPAADGSGLEAVPVLAPAPDVRAVMDEATA